MPLGIRGEPYSTRCMVGNAMVFSSPCRPTSPSPQNRTATPAIRIRTSRLAVRRSVRVARSSLANSAANFSSSRPMPRLPAARGASISILVSKQPDRSQGQDLEVEQRRPSAQIFEVVFDARLHVLDVRRLAAAAVDLRQPGDARRNLVANHVPLDELAILLVVSHGMRPRPYQA